MESKTTIFFLLLITTLFSLGHSKNENPRNDQNQTKMKITPTNKQAYRIPAVFAFGDSTLDPGNNNYIDTAYRSDHMPYGRDFPGYPASGRFTNGRIVPDFMVSYLGIKSCIPPYLYPNLNNQDLLTGVSFASAGSGLDDVTASTAKVLTMNTQVEYFGRYLSQIQNMIGRENASQLVGDSLFLIGAGTNDFVYSMYDLPIPREFQYSLPEYMDFIIQKLMSFVQRLYTMGARKFAVSGLPPLGCLPMQRTIGSINLGPTALQRVCVLQQNTNAQDYNNKLQTQILLLQSSLHGSIIAYVDAYGPLMDMIQNPSRYGFEESSRGCCGTGLIESGIFCSVISPTCSDASRFVFWDGVHPTDTTYQILANIFEQNVLPRFLKDVC